MGYGRKSSRIWLVAALMTLMFGGVMAAPAAVAGAAAKPQATTGSGTIEVCKSNKHGMAGQPFQFTLNGAAPFTVKGGACSGPMAAPSGSNTVVEAPTAGLEVAKIKANHVVSSNLSSGTVVVKVKAGSTPANETLVTYFNEALPALGLKVCKVAANPSLEGKLFSFTENGGAAYSVAAGTAAAPICGPVHSYPLNTSVNVAELATPNVHVSGITVSDGRGSNVNTAAGTVTATIGSGVTVVTYTNDVSTARQTGFIEVCKSAYDDEFVQGSFNFTISQGGVVLSTQSVLLGQCTAPIEVPIGNVTVAEAAQFPYYVNAVYVSPSNRSVNTNLANGTATVMVVSGDSSTETLVDFDNATHTGLFKVCKTLTANSAALAGQTFTFDVSTDFDYLHTDQIVAGPAGSTVCVIDKDAVPLGSTAQVSEVPTPNVQNIGISVSPAANDAGSVAPTANLTIGAGITTATFTNEAFGTVEICKVAADPSTAIKTFQFSVNGGASISVHAGQCSLPIAVPAGMATVAEAALTNFHLVGVTATGPTNDVRVVSGINPVTVATPFGGVENETVVTFTNAVNTGQFKVCKVSSEPTLQNVTFEFSWTYGFDGNSFRDGAELTPGHCSSLSPSLPVVDGTGAPVAITIGEGPIDGVTVSNISAQNAASFSPDLADEAATFSVNQGVTTITFTNVRTPPPTTETTRGA